MARKVGNTCAKQDLNKSADQNTTKMTSNVRNIALTLHELLYCGQPYTTTGGRNSIRLFLSNKNKFDSQVIRDYLKAIKPKNRIRNGIERRISMAVHNFSDTRYDSLAFVWL